MFIVQKVYFFILEDLLFHLKQEHHLNTSTIYFSISSRDCVIVASCFEGIIAKIIHEKELNRHGTGPLFFSMLKICADNTYNLI